jgi:hypothetical protein
MLYIYIHTKLLVWNVIVTGTVSSNMKWMKYSPIGFCIYKWRRHRGFPTFQADDVIMEKFFSEVVGQFKSKIDRIYNCMEYDSHMIQ